MFALNKKHMILKKNHFLPVLHQGCAEFQPKEAPMQQGKGDSLWPKPKQGLISPTQNEWRHWPKQTCDLWEQVVSGRSEAKGKDEGKAPFDIFFRATKVSCLQNRQITHLPFLTNIYYRMALPVNMKERVTTPSYSCNIWVITLGMDL